MTQHRQSRISTVAVAVWVGVASGYLLLGHRIASAEVPRVISYQGKLTEPDGTPVTGERTLLLRLYDAAAGGATLWNEEHRIALSRSDNGVFSVVMGSLTPFGPSLTFTDPVWLTIEVDGKGEFSPRQQLTAVSYAINAQTLDGRPASQFLGASALGQGAPQDVGAGAIVGALTTASRDDHLHRGVRSVAVTGGELLFGDVQLAAGSNVTLSQSGGTITIAAAGGGAGGGTTTNVIAGAGLTGGGASSPVTVDVGAGIGLVVNADDVAVDVGTGPNQIVQLDADGALPAVSGANLTVLNASALTTGTVPDAQLSANVSLLGQTIRTAELDDGAVTAAKLAANSVGADALAATAIQAGDIEPGDLPAHAATHQPGRSDALPTASAVSVGTANSAGTFTSLARADHTHQGVHALNVLGQPQLSGDLTLSAGSNVTLTQSGSDIEVAAAWLTGNRATAFATTAVKIKEKSDTNLLSVTVTKSHASSILLVLASVQLTNTKKDVRAIALKLFRGSTELDGGYTVQLGGDKDPAGQLPVTLHVIDPTAASGSLTFSLKARADKKDTVEAMARRLTVIEFP